MPRATASYPTCQRSSATITPSAKHRVLAAGDLNMSFQSTDPFDRRAQTVLDERMRARRPRSGTRSDSRTCKIVTGSKLIYASNQTVSHAIIPLCRGRHLPIFSGPFSVCRRSSRLSYAPSLEIQTQGEDICPYVTLREGEDAEALLKRFQTSMQRSGILRELRNRRFFRSKGRTVQVGQSSAVCDASDADADARHPTPQIQGSQSALTYRRQRYSHTHSASPIRIRSPGPAPAASSAEITPDRSSRL